MDDNEPKRDTFDAWACGSAMPAAVGYTGASASGWVIRLAGRDEQYDRKVMPSTTSNRRAWEAGIRAIQGVVENVPRRSKVKLRLNDKELVNAVNKGFIRTNGAPMAEEDFWRPLLTLRSDKDIELETVLADRRDETMPKLRYDVAEAAKLRAEELGLSRSLEDAVPPKPGKPGPFPPIEGCVEEPTPIYRKPTRGDW